MSQEIIELTEETAQQGVSRRGFIKGAIAASAAVSSSNYLFRANGGTLLAQSAAAGAVERLISVNVNGRSRRIQVPPMETLSTTLRYTMGLTGTKIGCDRAECGACTVLVDGVSHYACSTLTHTVRGREVTTIEGLEAEDGTLHPMQQAVLEEQGFQCAFCMSGFIMNTVALLNENQSPTRKEAAEWLSGNLCRCADYDKILTSVERAAEITRGA
ncbi:MAG: (2Fe-2S)-binding protein [Acidobacteriota bacterium]|nr:(2Fe-2S)-binding protein [Acidobacteriota bacterium]